LFLTNIFFIIILSALTGYFIPGFTSILLLRNIGVKIIAKKGIYLEKNLKQ